MATVVSYDIKGKNRLSKLGKALSSEERIEILQLLYNNPRIIGDIARELQMPVSSTAFHLKILEEAGLISMETQNCA